MEGTTLPLVAPVNQAAALPARAPPRHTTRPYAKTDAKRTNVKAETRESVTSGTQIAETEKDWGSGGYLGVVLKATATQLVYE